MMTLSEIANALQLSVGPTIIISACGLLMLSMTNRLGRAIDRSRVLARERSTGSEEFQANVDQQLEIIRFRCRLIREAILGVSACIFLTVILILLLFIFEATKLEAAWIIAAVFAASMGALLLAVVYFMRDIFKSLEAMEAEVGHSLRKR